MKKIFIIALLALIVPAMLFALDFSVGTSVATKYNFDDVFCNFDDTKEGFDFADLEWGAEANLKVSIAEADMTAFFAKNEDGKLVFHGMASGSLAIDLFIVRIKAGLGFAYFFDDGFYFANAVSKDFKESFMNCNVNARVGADVLLGNFEVGLFAYLPTSLTFSNGEWGQFFDSIKTGYKNSAIGLSVRYALI